MNMARRLVTSSLGKKFLVAITGAALFIFVIGHLLGNLQIFIGREAINRYGHFLQSTPEILWPARIGLLVCVVIHIWLSATLTIENYTSRETRYAVKRVVDASLASRTMIWSGLIIFSFVCFHLAHFTLLWIHPEYRNLYDPQTGYHDIYRMMVIGFSNPWVSGFYAVSIGLLCIHLGHGIESMFQSLGLKNEAWAARINVVGIVVAVLIFLGYVSIPAAVLAGMVK
ncbi:MAG TPA: succinate dehydrogenase cytochrome b subunit [Verrucomicrobiae bacterium]|nr:succinate dehydrogenase cytochrome b subunit [Verrucomicrobiae bacterium]